MAERAGPAPPRIGLTTYRARAAWGVWQEAADLLPATYSDAITAAGGVAMLLPPASGVIAEAALDGLHGLVLSGGPDIDPARYRAPRHAMTGPPHVERDEWELALAAAALERGMPLLGVCRGMQLLTVALGGTLCQHTPDVVGSESHCESIGTYSRHPVELATGSRLAGVFGTRTDVATHHHQSVDQLPDSLVATGWAPDGTVEALDVTGAYWAHAVQWHPEVLGGEPLFQEFVRASAGWRDAA